MVCGFNLTPYENMYKHNPEQKTKTNSGPVGLLHGERGPPAEVNT